MVLQAIRRSKKPLSKGELVQITGLSLATVTEHVERLIRSQLVTDLELGQSTGGRKPRLLSFNTEAGYIAAIDLESTHVHVGILDLTCSIIISRSRLIDVSQGPKAVLEQIKELLFQLLDESKIDQNLIKGIGMGLPGPVEFSTGLPASLPIMPGWDRYPIHQFWSQYFDCPCFVDNNVYTMLLGEHTVDSISDIENFIFLKVGNGIGAGIMVKGEIYRGASEYAGNIGHNNICHDHLCYCGNRGCLEAIAGGRAIARKAEQIAREGKSTILKEVLKIKGKITIDDVKFAVREADPVMVELIRESGFQIGSVLAGLVNFFNPSLICIGGSVAEIGDVLLASIRQAVYQKSLPISTRDLVIRSSYLGDKAGIIGAAVLTAEKIIDDSLIRTKEGTYSI